jgi:hypothetical protein
VAGAPLGLDVPIRQILAKDHRSDPATALVAEVVIRLAKEGERDPKRLAEKAIGVVRGSS